MPTDTDPLRAALAQAIDDKVKAESALEKHREAIARAVKLARDAETRLAAATAKLEKARGQRVHELAHAAAGGGPISRTPLRDERNEALDAQDELDAARAAVEVLQTKISGFEDAVRDAGDRAGAARQAVLVPIAAALLQQMREAETLLIVNNTVLSELLDIDKGSDPGDWKGRDIRNKPLEEVREEKRVFNRRGATVGTMDDREFANQIAARWSAAIKSLEADPFAALPQV